MNINKRQTDTKQKRQIQIHKHLMDACDSREQRDLGGEVIQALLEHVQSGDGLIKPLIHLRSTKSSHWEVLTGS